MEENNVRVKKSIKIKLIALITVLLICAAAVVGVLIAPKEEEVVKIPEENLEETLEKEQTASDEATLRKLLAKEEDLVIEVTEDIVIDRMISIKGTKTLTGSGSITMELYVAPYQYMFSVEKGGKLTLDGVKVDGNGSSNCFKVEKTAELTLLSGELTWGCPTIIESFGDVYIKGGSITDAIGTGVYVHSGGNAYMTAGTVRDCVDCGIETAVDSYLSVSEHAMLQNNMEYFIYSRGTCDITGGTFRDAQSDMVYTSGVMNVKGTAEKMLEWHDIKGCGFIVGNGGELNVDRLHIHDVENRAISMAAGESVANVSNCLFENTGGDGVYIRTEMNLTNVEIRNAGLSGIMLIQTGKATIDNVTVTGTVKDGIQNGGGVVTGKNFVVNNAGRIGVNCYKLNDVSGTVNLKNVTVNGTVNSNGLHVETSKMTVSNVKIYNTGNEGARIQKGGSLNLTNVEVHNAKGRSITSYDEGSMVTLKNVKTFGGQRGIGAFGGDVKATNVSIDGPTEYGVTGSKKSVVEITDLTIKNSGGTGVNANDAKITITNATIEDTKKTAAVNADYSGTIILKNADIKFAEGITENIDGVKAVSPANVTLEKVNMVNVPWRSVYANGADAKITLSDVTTTGGKRGIQIFKGGQVEGKTVTITSPLEYGVSCGDEGSGFKLTDLTVTGSGKHAVNVYDGAVATVTDGSFTKIADLGGFVGNKGKLTLNNVDISETKHSGLINDNATLVVKGGSIEKAGSHGVFTYKGGLTSLADFRVVNAAEHSVRADNENTKYILENVTTIGGTRGLQIYSGGKMTGNKISISLPTEYGISCGEEGSGFTITDLTVTECGKHAVNVYDSAIAAVTNGTFTKSAKQGAFVGNKGQLVLENVAISETGETALMNSNATLTVKGGSLDKAGENGVHTFDGGLTTITDYEMQNTSVHNVRVDNANSKCVLKNVTTKGGQRGIQIWTGAAVEGEDVTITSSTDYGITCGDDGSSFEITNLTINRSGDSGVSCGNHAINVYQGAKGILNGALIINPAKYGVNVSQQAELTLKNGVDITFDAGRTIGAEEIQGISVDAATLTVEDKLTIKNAVNRGMRNIGGTINGSDAVIDIHNPGTFGLAVSNAGTATIGTLNITGAKGYSSMTVNDAGTVVTIHGGEILDSVKHGLNVSKGTLNLNHFEVKDFGEYGIEAQEDSTVKLNDVTITGGQRGIRIQDAGKVIESKDVTITSSSVHAIECLREGSNFHISGLTVQNSGNHALNIWDKATGTVNGLTEGEETTKSIIANPGGHGANLDKGAALTLHDVDITFAKDKTGTFDGVHMSRSANVTLQNVKVTDAPRHGVHVDDGVNDSAAYGTNGKLTLAGTLEVISPKARGLANYGSSIDGSTATVTITNPGQFGVAVNGGKTSTIGTLNITGAGKTGDSYSSMTVNGTGTVVTVNGGKIENSWKHGLNVEYGTLNLSNFTIKDSGKKNDGNEYDGVNAQKQSTVNLTNVTIIGGGKGINAVEGANVTITGGNISGVTGTNLYVTSKADDTSKSNATINGTLTMTGAKRGLAIYNGSTVTKGKNGGNITITSPTEHGVRLYNSGSSLNIDTLNVTGGGVGVEVADKAQATIANGTISNTTGHGVYVKTQAQVTIAGGTISNTAGHGVYIEGSNNASSTPQSKATLSGTTISNAGTTADQRGIFLEKYGETELTNVNINNTKKGDNLYLASNSKATINGTLTTQGGRHGLAIYGGSSVTKGENKTTVTIKSPSSNGVRLWNAGSNLNVTVLNVDKCGANGLEVNEGTTTIGEAANITEAKDRSIRVDNNGTLQASTATITITSSTSYALSASGTTTTATVGTLNVTGAGGWAAVNATDSSTITINGGRITGATGFGVNANKTATLNLTNCTILNSAKANINAEASGVTINLTGMTQGVHYDSLGDQNTDRIFNINK